MLDNFIFSLNSVSPVFIIIFLGYVLRKNNVLSEKTIGEMNGIVFSIALPAMLFRDVYRSDIGSFFDIRLVAWASISVFIGFAVFWAAAEIYLKDRQALIGAFAQGSFRGNYAIIGLPLIANILGVEGVAEGALVTAFTVPIFNVLSVVVLSAKSKGANKYFIKSTVISICKNPLIHGVLLGIAASAFKIKLPGAINVSINYMGALCTPLALLAVGGSFKVSDAIKNAAPALVAATLKTVVNPLIFVTASVALLGFRGNALIVLFILHSTPTAVSSFIMASKMGADETLAASILILSTIISVFTLTAGIYLLKNFSLI